MTVDKLLATSPRLREILIRQLEEERTAIDVFLKQLSGRTKRSYKRRVVAKPKKLHWTQRPENRAKKNAIIKKMLAARRVKKAA